MTKINIYTTTSINVISLIVTIVVFLTIFLISNIFSKVNFESFNSNQNFSKKIISKDNNSEEVNTVDINQNQEKDYNWYIEIKSINLKAPIEETIEDEVLFKYVGHFEDTSLKEGNIGLAAHNRGYEVNYFENLKSVKIGDEIIYKYDDFKTIYEIDTIEIIEDTDWSYLENTDENKITLITCVENEPNFRRCVQATEKE